MLATKALLSRQVKIQRAPDPSLVICSGPGLESPALGGPNTVQVDGGLDLFVPNNLAIRLIAAKLAPVSCLVPF